MPSHKEAARLKNLVRDSIRTANTDLNQAANYFLNSQYDGYEKNLIAVVDNLKKLYESTKQKI